MSKNWYPIINSKCKLCQACIVACPLGLLNMNNRQINLQNGEKCPEGCLKCKAVCGYKAITYYDGTTESLINAFSGNDCSCGCGEKH